MRLNKTFLNSMLAAALLVPASAVLAQGGGGGGGKAKESESRSFLLSLPVVNLSGATLGHAEFNLGGQGSLGLEGGVQRKLQQISESDMIKDNESLVTDAMSVTLMISRFTDSAAMGGFYWSLGVGYREETAQWSVPPKPDDKEADLGLVDGTTGALHHDVTLKGTTANGRLGYRFVGSDWPIVVGLYIGARHFQATVRDAESDGEDTAEAGEASVTYVNMTAAERDALKRREMTKPDAGFEVGVVF